MARQLWDDYVAEREQREKEAARKSTGKSIVLINTSNCTRWWLPNRDYWYEIKIVNGYAVHRVVHNETQMQMERIIEVNGKPLFVSAFKLPIGHPRYDEITLYAVELANKVFRRPPKAGKEKEKTVFYNVVDVNDRSKFLMNISTTQLSIAATTKGAWKMKHPDHNYEIVETDDLEPWKKTYKGNVNL